jgi:hypothetical protein
VAAATEDAARGAFGLLGTGTCATEAVAAGEAAAVAADGFELERPK